jgi:hypothetical protein
MRGEQVGKTAHFAAAHRVGLAGEGEWTGPGFADAPGGEMNVDNRVHLVGTPRALIDALRK